MPVVEEVPVITARAADAWAAVTDVEVYPETMGNVREVRIVEHLDADRRRAEWTVLLRGSVLKWTEVEVLDHDRRVVTFQQESGDMETFSGYWSVNPIDEQTCSVTLYVDFEIGIPLLADMLNPIAATALRESALTMLNGLERRVPR